MPTPELVDQQDHPLQPYQYRPLEGTRQETRILLITSTEPPEFDFEYVSMTDDQVAAFDAISWCWGVLNPSENKNITIKGCSLSICANAYEVLLELCIAQKKLRVWIDAVCINQKDIAERGQQVAMMCTIYEKAAMTLVWPGKDDETAGRSMQMIKNIVDWRQVRLGHASGARYYYNEATTDPFLPEMDWNTAASFFSAAWFQRFWIIQEVVLSRHVHVFVGKYKMCWRYLVSAAHYMSHNISYAEILVSGGEAGIASITMIGRIQGRSMSALLLLDYSTMFQATQPMDRVFAIYGLLNEKSLGMTQLAALREAFSPDYALPLMKIYANATKAAISFSSVPSLLLKAQCLV